MAINDKTLDEAIARFKAEADEWRHLSETCREDEEEGHRCSFSAGSDEYLRRASDADKVAEWLECYKNICSDVEEMIDSDVEEMIDNESLTANAYQRMAERTIDRNLKVVDVEYHALHGMVGEIGEIHSIFQKEYQGHDIEEEHLKKEVGDLLWFIAEFCSANSWELEDIMRMNIKKLEARYPEGFEADKSLHRREGDI